jgi:predicted DNA-binding protein
MEEATIERLRTIFFRCVKDKTLIEWYLNECDDLYNYAELDEILDMGKAQKEGKKKKKHVEKKIQDVVIKTKSKKEKKVKDVFDEVLLKTEEETDEDGEKPVKYNEKETGEMLEKAFEKF